LSKDTSEWPPGVLPHGVEVHFTSTGICYYPRDDGMCYDPRDDGNDRDDTSKEHHNPSITELFLLPTLQETQNFIRGLPLRGSEEVMIRNSAIQAGFNKTQLKRMLLQIDGTPDDSPNHYRFTETQDNTPEDGLLKIYADLDVYLEMFVYAMTRYQTGRYGLKGHAYHSIFESSFARDGVNYVCQGKVSYEAPTISIVPSKVYIKKGCYLDVKKLLANGVPLSVIKQNVPDWVSQYFSGPNFYDPHAQESQIDVPNSLMKKIYSARISSTAGKIELRTGRVGRQGFVPLQKEPSIVAIGLEVSNEYQRYGICFTPYIEVRHIGVKPENQDSDDHSPSNKYTSNQTQKYYGNRFSGTSLLPDDSEESLFSVNAIEQMVEMF
jgi:hypothetical protein